MASIGVVEMEREEYVGLGVFWRKRRLNLLMNLMQS